MKRAGELLDRIADRDNLLLAYVLACRGCRSAPAAVAFGRELDAELATLRKGLLEGSIAVGAFTSFPIRDPKPRQIHAPMFRERVLHHALIHVGGERLERYLIDDTFACRKGKGTHAAVARAEQFAARYRYVLKLDVRRYFDSIDHELLLRQLARLWKDRAVLRLVERIVHSYEAAPGKGLPIGSLTSQHFANVYLGVLDHHVKNVMRFRGYVRYMDDVLLFGDDARQLRGQWRWLQGWLWDTLRLRWKQPQVIACARGVPFLGFRLLPGHRRLSAERRRRFARRLRGLAIAFQRGAFGEDVYHQRLLSLCSHAEQAQDRDWRRRLLARLAAAGLDV